MRIPGKKMPLKLEEVPANIFEGGKISAAYTCVGKCNCRHFSIIDAFML
jgi:hypothetical protein